MSAQFGLPGWGLDEHAILRTALDQFLIEKECDQWESAIRAAFPGLVVGAAEVVDRLKEAS